ncbi:unnamed protein product [Caenorhabditis angaria]|uniref:Homeobox domain-containing protein n=1 Tax=Caenorhabditis angaria TaxID=860376 RepID=A0A9P1I904_9PELO|nr:unnamed protein product [Caenorhabditis angaria]
MIERRKTTRKRTTFTVEQLYVLEHYFGRSQYVGAVERARLSVMLGLEEMQIKIWFQNRRIRWRRDENRRAT